MTSLYLINYRETYAANVQRIAALRIKQAVLGERCTVVVKHGQLRGSHDAIFVRRTPGGYCEVQVVVNGRHRRLITDPSSLSFHRPPTGGFDE